MEVTNKDYAVNVEQLFSHAKDGNVEEVKSLIASGVDVNVVDRNDKTVLHYAAQQGDVKLCEYLVSKGAEVNVGEITITPLHLACSEGHFGVVKLLISQGADVNLYNSDIYTPLHCAMKHGYAEICEYLVSQGADVNIVDDKKNTPLHMACAQGNLVVVQMLISHGAQLELRNVYQNTSLYIAVAHRYKAICEYLLNKGANHRIKNKTGLTPLSKGCCVGDLSLVKLLVSYGASVNSTDDSKDKTPLHYAAENGHWAVCQHLLLKGAQVDALAPVEINVWSNKLYVTPLHLAYLKEHLSVFKVLISHGANFNLHFNLGNPLLRNYSRQSIDEYLNTLHNSNHYS